MTAAVGFPTLRLVRIRIGDIFLDQLAPGAVIEVENFNLGWLCKSLIYVFDKASIYTKIHASSLIMLILKDMKKLYNGARKV